MNDEYFFNTSDLREVSVSRYGVFMLMASIAGKSWVKHPVLGDWVVDTKDIGPVLYETSPQGERNA